MSTFTTSYSAASVEPSDPIDWIRSDALTRLSLLNPQHLIKNVLHNVTKNTRISGCAISFGLPVLKKLKK